MPGEVPKTSAPLPSIPNFPVLVPDAIDHRSYNDADRVVITYVVPGTNQTVDLTWADFGKAVDKAAWVFDKKLGARGSSNEPGKTVAVLARSDASYMVTIYALHKCGITPLLLSTRNSHAAIVNLLKLTSSTAILADRYHKEVAKEASDEIGGLPIHDLAALPTTTEEERVFYPFNLKYEDECDKPSLILHTSGSTGLPKPVAWSCRFFWHQTYYPSSYVAKYFGSSFLSTLPIFHGSGFSLIRASLLWLGWKVIFPDSSRPVTGPSILELCTNPQISPDIVAGAPSLIEEIATLPGGWEVMRQRKSWFCVGAPIPPHFGDSMVKEGVHFTPNLGSTETGQMSVLEPLDRSPEDWNYHEIRPDLDIVLEPRGASPGSGPYELIILSKDGWKPGVINVNVNGVDGYATSDLYEKHLTKEHLLKHRGRIDDVIVLSNGEKTLSRAIEVPIEADPHVQNAIVFGTGRSQNGVMVVPSTGYAFDYSEEKLREFRNLIWSSVEKANSVNPAHSQIWKEMILVTSPHKQLPRTDKGSVKRKAAIELYSDEIDKLYRAAEGLASAHRPPIPSNLDAMNLVTFFEALVEETMGRKLAADTDVFEQGMDSLKAIYLRNALLSSLKTNGSQNLIPKVPQNFVFSNPSARTMAEAISRLARTGELTESGQETAEEHARMINSMVLKYTQNFPTHIPQTNNRAGSEEVVILTGSTGSLGTYLLNSLLSTPHVVKIYAFNREGSAPSLDRQTRAYSERMLDTGILSSATSSGRLVFHDVSMHETNFGLPDNVYEEILISATLIIHNAWALNFNWTLDAFEPVHIKGVRNLVDFALGSPKALPPRIVFTSSISTVGAYTSGPVPEEPLQNPQFCMPHGYARAKFVGERILALASDMTPLKTVSFRIGQIAGDTANGIWNETDSIPVLLRGCQELGAIPTDWVPAISWTPANNVAQVIIDISLNKVLGGSTYHITNPNPTRWSDLLPFIESNLFPNNGRAMELITMAEWIDRLKNSAQSADQNPAIKLITFFENALKGNGVRCRLGLDKTKEASPTMSSIARIDDSAFALFLDHWRRNQFLRASYL